MPISTKSIRASFRSKNEQKKRFALYFLLPSTFFFLRLQLSVRWYFGDLKVGNTNRETKKCNFRQKYYKESRKTVAILRSNNIFLLSLCCYSFTFIVMLRLFLFVFQYFESFKYKTVFCYPRFHFYFTRMYLLFCLFLHNARLLLFVF